MARRIIGACAAVALAVVDYLLLAVSFLYRPEPAEWLLIAGLVIFLTAVVLRLGWLLLLMQAVVTAIVVYRIFDRPSPQTIQTSGSDVTSILFIVSVLVVAFALAWSVVRALPRHRWRDDPRDAYPSAGK